MKRFSLACLLILLAAGCTPKPTYTVFKALDAPLEPGTSVCVSPIDRSHVMVNERGETTGPSLATAEQIRASIIEALSASGCFSEVGKSVGLTCDAEYLIAGKLQVFEESGGVPQSHPSMMYVKPKDAPFRISVILSVTDVKADRVIFSAMFESGTSNVIVEEQEAYEEIAGNFAAAICSGRQ